MQSSIARARVEKRDGAYATPVVVGASFRNSSIDYRERLATLLEDKPEWRFVTELAILKTCSRIELVFSSPRPEEATREILSGWRGELGEARAYVRQGRDAIVHLFGVASGLDSIVVGEDQILQQLRTAARTARQAGTSGRVIAPLLDAALNAGKRVREATGAAGGSLGAFGVRRALEVHRVRPSSVLLIGTGSTARIAAERLGSSDLYIATRRESVRGFPRAKRVPWREIKKMAAVADLIVSASNYDGYVLRKGDIPDDRRRTILDLSFPRNIDPAYRKYRRTQLIDLDDLAVYAEGASKASPGALEMVREEAETFELWLHASKVDPTLSEIFRWSESVRKKETELALAKLGQLTPQQRRTVEKMGARIVSKLLARPARYAKAAVGTRSQRERLEILRAIFADEVG